MLDGLSWESDLLVGGDDHYTAVTQMRLQSLGQVTCGHSIE